MDRIVESLKAIGYSDKEAIAYVTLLRLGRGTAYAIADASGLKKPTAHIILGELLKRGAVVTVPGATKRMFIARSPEDLFAEAEDRFIRAKKSVPALLSIVAESRSEFKTLYFEGLRGLREALDYKLDSSGKEVVGFYALADRLAPETEKLFRDWDKGLKREHVRVRGFTPEHPSTDAYRKNLNKNEQDIRALPLSEYSSEVSIEAQGSFVRITDIQHLQCVVIDNPHIAKTVKQIFEMFWNRENGSCGQKNERER